MSEWSLLFSQSLQLGGNSKSDLFEELTKIEDEFPGYVIYAQLVLSKFCIMFSSPEMTMSKLPFETYSMITDVTFKVVCEGYYLCSTVIHVPEMQKHVVIFQAIIKHLSVEQFEALFSKFAIRSETFLGMIMDFSSAQREGFIKAFSSSFGLDRPQAMSFLKGCYMHWKQSVQRIVSNYAVVPREKSALFLSLTYRMQKTTVDQVFIESAGKIL